MAPPTATTGSRWPAGPSPPAASSSSGERVAWGDLPRDSTGWPVLALPPPSGPAPQATSSSPPASTPPTTPPDLESMMFEAEEVGQVWGGQVKKLPSEVWQDCLKGTIEWI